MNTNVTCIQNRKRHQFVIAAASTVTNRLQRTQNVIQLCCCCKGISPIVDAKHHELNVYIDVGVGSVMRTTGVIRLLTNGWKLWSKVRCRRIVITLTVSCHGGLDIAKTVVNNWNWGQYASQWRL